MLADKNDAIKEAAATMYVMSADEKIRMQCEARERKHFASLANRLKADHRDDEIITAATDPQYCEKLYKEYQL